MLNNYWIFVQDCLVYKLICLFSSKNYTDLVKQIYNLLLSSRRKFMLKEQQPEAVGSDLPMGLRLIPMQKICNGFVPKDTRY